jgi:hypothetical protein
MKFPVTIFLLLLLTASSWGQPHKPARTSSRVDSGYVLALAAADHFLHAWQTGDLENGVVLLSDGIRHSQNAEKLEQLFASGGASRAYEIGAGRRHHGRYSFPIVLLAPQGSRVLRKSSEIILVNTGKNDWVVDRLP